MAWTAWSRAVTVLALVACGLFSVAAALTNATATCVRNSDGILVVTPPLPSSAACLVISNGTWTFLGQNATVDGSTGIFTNVGALSAQLYVESYALSNCTGYITYAACNVTFIPTGAPPSTAAPSTAAPTTAAPTTAAPTTAVPTGSPTSCVVTAAGILLITPPFGGSACVAVYNSSYAFLNQNVTSSGIGVFTSYGTLTPVLFREGYGQSNCTSFLAYYRCNVTYAPTSAPTTAAPTTAAPTTAAPTTAAPTTAAPTTAVPTGSPTSCVVTAAGILLITPPFGGSTCVVVYNSSYSYLADNATSGGVGVFTSYGTLTPVLFVEGYGQSNCTSYLSYYRCTVSYAPTSAPTTATPTTATPTTATPTTAAPTTTKPTTAVPTTAAPTTAAPTTGAPTTAAPTTAVPTGSPTSCVVTAAGILLITPPFGGSACVVLYNSSYSYLADNATSGGVGVFTSYGTLTPVLFVEGYGQSNCSSYLSYYRCNVTYAPTSAPTTAAPTTAAPTTATPTTTAPTTAAPTTAAHTTAAPTTAVPTGSPSSCVVTAAGIMLITPPFGGSACVVVYNSSYAFLNQNVTSSGVGVFTSYGTLTPVLFVEGYGQSNCSSYVSYYRCNVTYAPTSAPTTTAPTTTAPTTATPTTTAPTTAAPTTAAPTTASPTTAAPSTAAPTTAVPTGSPSSCVVTAAGILLITPPFGGSACVVLYNSSYSYLADNATSGGVGVFTSYGTLTPLLFVEGYGQSNCTSYLSYYRCEVSHAPTSAPTTAAPTTMAPTTPAPTTAAPTTAVPTTAAPTTAMPTGSPTSCAVTAAGILLITPPFGGSACVILYNSSYSYLSQDATSDGVGVFTSYGALTPILFVEGYGQSDCSSYLSYFRCNVTYAPTSAPPTAAPTTATPTSASPSTTAPTTAAPTTVAPTTAAPTGLPTSCVLNPGGTLTVTPTFGGSTCIIIYNATYAFLALNETAVNATAVFAPPLALTPSLYVEGYANANCTGYIAYFRCSVLNGPTDAPTVVPSTAAPPTGSPTACQLYGPGVLVVTPPFNGSVCLLVYNASYSYLAQNVTDPAYNGSAIFIGLAPAVGIATSLFVEGYSGTDCTVFRAYFACTVVAAPATSTPEPSAVPTEPSHSGASSAAARWSWHTIGLLLLVSAMIWA